MEHYRNKLIVFEGLDRSGKSSIAKRLNEYLNQHNIPSIYTFQPGDTRWGTNAVLIRSLCKDKRHNLHPLSNFFAFLLDKVEHTDKVVVPYLEDGYTVISDRWHYSNIAYQLYGKQLLKEYNVPEEVALWLNQTAIQCKDPDIVLYFPDKLNIHRDEDVNDSFDNETIKFFERVKKSYNEMAEKNNWVVITPAATEETTFYKVLDVVNERSVDMKKGG